MTLTNSDMSHSLTQKIRHLVEAKKSRLCVSLDVTSCEQLLKFAEMLGPYVVMIKTHIDILEDFSWGFIEKLLRLSEQYQFLLFEDRKFADIGHTVSLQYSKGIYRIADWAHITNAHILPGPGIIEGLKKAALAKDRGILLLAQMSSQGNFFTEEYQNQCVQLARQYEEVVIGFVAQERLALLSNTEDFLIFTPGVQLSAKQDALGQGYVTPKAALKRGADILIVGRGIYAAEDPVAAARMYAACT